MTDRAQPAELAFAPPAYASPALDSPGRVATVRLERAVGFLVRGGDGLAWWGLYRADDETEEAIVRGIVRDTLRTCAARGDDQDAAWDSVLRLVLHDPPATVARLNTVAALLR
ncbi:hypothetical protein [Nitriliruptor alkaliphilus]|uniref:hypothetical protein n=1 Tax=Nitriliruptor alkaliphilus TaxID=427918 RepID=UPI000698A30A|nr:hypothetical protein [Nitriliruptor alkaliphilus]